MSAADAAMDRIYRHQRHIYDLTRRYYLVGRDDMLARLSPPPGGRVLEIACGTARNLIMAHRLHPDAALFGLDVSQEMLASARRAVRRNGLSDRIALAQGDATRFDPAILFGQSCFSRIFVSYGLSMMPGWQQAIDQAVHWLHPDGELHVVDFGNQAGLPRLFRTGLRRWLKQFHVQPRDELETVLRRRPDVHVVTFEHPSRGYAHYAVVKRRGLTWP